jgi:phosphoribosylaminoimidazole-succinocarboxamide synthase
MTDTTAVGEITLRNYPHWRSGKVREIFDLGDRFLFVASDRVSAFDVILPNLIPGKGRLLTQISRFWFEETQHIAPNHVVSFELDDLELDPSERAQLEGRSMVVRKADRIDIECVVRNRLAGSGFEEYRRHGTLAGEPLPAGLRAGDQLPELRFTPATKNDQGHDENISVDAMREMVGRNLTELLETTSKALFRHAQSVAEKAGFALADSKFEFGFIDANLTLIDEVLTPDSSRYWKLDELKPGTSPQGYDKQLIRDWLLSTGWDREPPAPELPSEIIDQARGRYAEVLERLQATRSGTDKHGGEQE